jgi:Rrf2 family protein
VRRADRDGAAMKLTSLVIYCTFGKGIPSTKGDAVLRIRKDIEYALITLVALEDSGRAMSTRELAERFNISLSLLRKILHFMNRSGLIEAVRGPQGGYRLKGSLEELTVQDVVEALSGPLGLVTCINGEPCDQQRCCNIQPNMGALQGMLSGFLASISVAEFARLGGGAEFQRRNPESAESPATGRKNAKSAPGAPVRDRLPA